MKLTREQMLDEMGLTPLWRERAAQPAELATAQVAGVPAAAPAEAPSLARPAVAVPPRQATPAPPVPAQVLAPKRPVMPLVQSGEPVQAHELDWQGLGAAVAACRACALCEQRTQAVLGVGDPAADWLFIGEGPGAEEDVRGEPFVGQAGKLLDNMLAALDLARGDQVYIANAVKCRPPGNRTPEAGEMAACRPYLARQIALIQPKVIVLLGKAAVHSVLGLDQTLGGLRGKRHDYQGIPVVVTYHPAYLLRNLPEKAKAWEDLLLARRLLRQAA